MTLDKRPRTLDDVVGHDKIVKTMKEYSKDDRCYPQVMLFEGSSGIGKTSLAQITAQTLACESPVVDSEGVKTPCCTCNACQDIIHERFGMDVVYKDCSGMGKQDILALEDELNMGASYGVNKVILLEEAQQLSTKASMGALLRILEKPRKNAYIILMTMDLTAFPKAVQDRCSIFKFKKFKTKEISDYLMTLLDEIEATEEQPFPDSIIEVIVAVASNADGSMRKALQDFQRCLDSKIFTEEELIEELEITTESKLESFLMQLLDRKPTALLEVSKASSLSNIFTKTMQMMINWKKSYVSNNYYDGSYQQLCEKLVSNPNFNDLLDTFLDIRKDNVGYFDNNIFYYHILKYLDNTSNSSKKVAGRIVENKSEEVAPVGRVGRRRKLKESV